MGKFFADTVSHIDARADVAREARYLAYCYSMGWEINAQAPHEIALLANDRALVIADELENEPEELDGLEFPASWYESPYTYTLYARNDAGEWVDYTTDGGNGVGAAVRDITEWASEKH